MADNRAPGPERHPSGRELSDLERQQQRLAQLRADRTIKQSTQRRPPTNRRRLAWWTGDR